MASNLNQIQVSFDQVQDRLILNFNTQDFFEYKFWVTRRVLKGLWNVLQRLIQGFTKEQMAAASSTKQIGKKVKQEMQVAEAAKYTTLLTRHPLGEGPLLLTKVMATPVEGGKIHFRLEDIQGRAVEFSGDALLVGLLTRLIEQIVPKTEWDLTLS